MATAVGFDATLPESMTDDHLERMFNWAKETCKSSDVYMREGKLHLIATRKEPKTVRQFQSLLRTSLSNWGVELPAKMSGWLELVSQEDFEKRRQEPYQNTQAEKPDMIAPPVEHEPTEFVIESKPIYRLHPPVNLLRTPHAIRCS